MKAIVHHEEDRTKAILTSLMFHAALLALIFLYRFAAPETIEEVPPPIAIDLGGPLATARSGYADRGPLANPFAEPLGRPLRGSVHPRGVEKVEIEGAEDDKDPVEEHDAEQDREESGGEGEDRCEKATHARSFHGR